MNQYTEQTRVAHSEMHWRGGQAGMPTQGGQAEIQSHGGQAEIYSRGGQAEIQTAQAAQPLQFTTVQAGILPTTTQQQTTSQAVQPLQFTTVQAGTLPTTTQQQTTSQAEQSVTQRSISPINSVSDVSGGGQAEAPIGTGVHHQFTTEIGSGHTGGASQGVVGTTEVGERRKGRHRKEVIRLPDQPTGQVRQVRNRLPTPEPDVIERVYMQRTAGEVVEEITEIPTTPPPRIQERTVVEPAGEPKIIKRTVRVPPRGGPYGTTEQHQQQRQQYQQQGTTFQSSSNQFETGNISNIQQTAASYQQQQPTSSYNQQSYSSYQQPVDTSYSGGYSAATAVGGFPQPQQPVTHPITFTVGGGPGPVPQPGCQPAFCFYV